MMLDYYLALCYPSDMAEAASEVDNLLCNMLEGTTGLDIPMLDMESLCRVGGWWRET